ncbi:MAG TPA: polysaccharide deacetylase family protein [Chthoniobacterales bacterium]|nr:polysaccharide deacetylase family protein [Chthoniobacterales bacterium]
MPSPPDNAAPLRTALLVLAAIAPVVSIFLIGHGVIVAVAPLFVSHMLLLYPTLVANSQWLGPVFTSFHTTAREVWITIDDGPSPAHTRAMLDILQQFDARATFFVVGQYAETHPHLLTEILTRGHSLANHTNTHPSRTFWCASARRIRREIDGCAEHLRSTAERPAQFFRAPAGMKNFFVHPALARRGLVLIGWTVRGLDTVKQDPVKVAERVEKHARPGAIVLLHEGHHGEKHPDFQPRCLELTLQRLAARGYKFVIPQPEQLRCSRGRCPRQV